MGKFEDVFGIPEEEPQEEPNFNIQETDLFGIIKDINSGSKETSKFLKEHGRLPKAYNQFIINQAFGNTIDTILWANDMNLYGSKIPDEAHFLYYRGVIKPKKRFGKWFKPVKDETINHLASFLNCTRNEVIKNLALIPKEIIQELEGCIKDDGKTIKNGGKHGQRTTNRKRSSKTKS